jgi:DNA-binding transcriptional regulator YiaG
MTLREFNHLCLPPIETLAPEQIKKIREDSNGSSPLS